MEKGQTEKHHPTIACCGIDCGLCPRYYTIGTSRCPGCAGPDFKEKHPSCGFITCCVKKNGFEVCAQCDEFPCPKFNGWDAGDSFVSHARSLENLRFIKAHGLAPFLAQQQERIRLLEILLKDFDEGRSRNFYCTAAALLPISDLREMIKSAGPMTAELKQRAQSLRSAIAGCAGGLGIELKLRRKQ